jgi:hypothetical protein
MGWAIELRKPKIRVPTPWLWREGNIGDSANRELKAGPGVVREPSTLRNNMHENRETSAASRSKRERSGKAICRKPDMNAVEGSDRAVVPMKLPNKEAFALAEAVEGRARTKENAAELHTSPTQSGEIRAPRGFVACAEWILTSGQVSKVGAVCGSAARTDLCGGRSAMAVPTATDVARPPVASRHIPSQVLSGSR